MRLKLVPESARCYHILVYAGPYTYRQADADTFTSLVALMPRIRLMAINLLGDDFMDIRPAEHGQKCLLLKLRKLVSVRRQENFEDFKGWLSLFALEDPHRIASDTAALAHP